MLSTFSIILSNLLQKKAKVIYTFVFCLRGKIVHVSLIAGFRNSSNIDLRKFKCIFFFFNFLFDYLKRNQYFNAFFETRIFLYKPNHGNQKHAWCVTWLRECISWNDDRELLIYLKEKKRLEKFHLHSTIHIDFTLFIESI